MLANRRSIPLLLLLAAPAAQAQTAAPPVPPPPGLVATPPPPPPPVAVAAVPAPAPTPPPSDDIPLRLALQAEGAFGVGTGSFYNQLVGGRLDLRFSERTSLGAYLGYANLKGANGRAHSALTYAQVEYLVGDPAATVRFPLRFASGYLGGNGPIVRTAFGFAFAVGQKVDLVTELVAPTVWFTNNQTLLSLDLSLELVIRL